ncbi:MAG: mannosyltransferase family protein [Thermoflexales bacterium]
MDNASKQPLQPDASRRAIIGIWAAWAAALLIFQAIVPMRLELVRPDSALTWTPNETRRASQNDKPYLVEPFLNAQVGWDSEFYLSIATAGYDDPLVRAVRAGGRMLSLNYAFFPGYPIAIAIAAWPIRWIGLTQITGSTLGGVVVSLVAALFAMFAIAELAGKDPEDRADGIRAATYLLIFPSGFFLAQVFTESLFLALTLWCLVFARRGNWLIAGALAIGVTLTRATGVALVVPLAFLAWRAWDSAAGRDRVLSSLAAAVPVIVFAAWRISPLGQSFAAVEQAWFGREFLSIDKSFYNTYQAVLQMTGKNTQAMVYFALEFGAVALAAAGCVGLARRHPDIALFSAAVLVGSITSGYIQSMVRYTLTMPAMFFWLARLGRRPAFDRGWSFASTLLLGMLAMLFTFDMWVA